MIKKYYSMLWVLAACSLTGCLSSSPRFTLSESPAPQYDTTTQRALAEFTKETEEEKAENDKKIEINDAAKRITTTNENNLAIDRHEVLGQIMNMMGIPYTLNGSDGLGIDCSGFTANVYHNALRKTLPHSTQAQYVTGHPVENGQLKFGDLVFFRTVGESPSHVGIYVGDGLFAHASVSMGVTISLLESSYYKRRYVGARRIVQ